MSSQLNEIEDYQKQFIANVSHDFRSPLTSIKGYVEAIADGTIPPENMEKYLKIILFETDRLTDLTKDLLTLSDFDIKGICLKTEDFDINEMIKTIAASFEGTCVKKRIEIRLILADYKTFVKADPGKIQQVLYNLLDNAIKFSDNDSAITVETTLSGGKIMERLTDFLGIHLKFRHFITLFPKKQSVFLFGSSGRGSHLFQGSREFFGPFRYFIQVFPDS